MGLISEGRGQQWRKPCLWSLSFVFAAALLATTLQRAPILAVSTDEDLVEAADAPKGGERNGLVSGRRLSVECGPRPLAVVAVRFATACGMSSRLRLDLVLNDFAAYALVNRRIEILGDGTPWRPLIDIEDMARAIDCAVSRDRIQAEPF